MHRKLGGSKGVYRSSQGWEGCQPMGWRAALPHTLTRVTEPCSPAALKALCLDGERAKAKDLD